MCPQFYKYILVVLFSAELKLSGQLVDFKAEPFHQSGVH